MGAPRRQVRQARGRSCAHARVVRPWNDALDDLLELLDLEAIEVNIFRGGSPDEKRQRVFGGQVAGQALVAATRTVDEPNRLVHSLHAYFLRPGDPTVPILYEVDRIRDGRSFTTRRVVAIQHGKAIFNLQASFHDHEPGMEHQAEMPTDVGDPEDLPDWKTRMEPHKELIGEGWDRPRPIDVRFVDGDPMRACRHVGHHPAGVAASRRRAARRPDACTTACVTYASDMTLLDTTLLPFGSASPTSRIQLASLDHAMWFHRPFRADEWLLYSQQVISTSSARGLARGEIFTADGKLAVSVMQEGLIRVRR